MFNPFSKIPSATAREVFEKIGSEDIAFIDVRTPAEYDGGHAKGAINIPLDTLDTRIKELSGYHEVYAICQSGGRSGEAVRILTEAGVNAVNVAGGTFSWRAIGLPLE